MTCHLRLKALAAVACACGPSASGAPSITSGSIHVIVEPSDDGVSLLHAIRQARDSIHMTMYILTSQTIEDALIAQSRRGHDVRVILNSGTIDGESTGNAGAFERLSRAGVHVVWSRNDVTLTHEKCVIIDHQTAWIMTMNATWSAPAHNREYIVIDRTPAHIRAAEALFDSDYSHERPPRDMGGLLMAPLATRASLLATLALAHDSIEMEAEELTDPSILHALASRSAAGVTVRVVLPDGPTHSTQVRAIDALRSVGVTVRFLALPYVHAKAFVVDHHDAYIGSANFTPASLDGNRELGLLFDVPSEVRTVSDTIARDFSSGVF